MPRASRPGPREAESSDHADPPGLAPRPRRGAAPVASWQQGLPGTLPGAVTHASPGQLAERSKRRLLSAERSKPRPTGRSSDRPRGGNHHDRPATNDHGSNDVTITGQN